MSWIQDSRWEAEQPALARRVPGVEHAPSPAAAAAEGGVQAGLVEAEGLQAGHGQAQAVGEATATLAATAFDQAMLHVAELSSLEQLYMQGGRPGSRATAHRVDLGFRATCKGGGRGLGPHARWAAGV